jgi:hypothetical protein
MPELVEIGLNTYPQELELQDGGMKHSLLMMICDEDVERGTRVGHR